MVMYCIRQPQEKLPRLPYNHVLAVIITSEHASLKGVTSTYIKVASYPGHMVWSTWPGYEANIKDNNDLVDIVATEQSHHRSFTVVVVTPSKMF